MKGPSAYPEGSIGIGSVADESHETVVLPEIEGCGCNSPGHVLGLDIEEGLVVAHAHTAAERHLAVVFFREQTRNNGLSVHLVIKPAHYIRFNLIWVDKARLWKGSRRRGEE